MQLHVQGEGRAGDAPHRPEVHRQDRRQSPHQAIILAYFSLSETIAVFRSSFLVCTLVSRNQWWSSFL